MLIHFLWGILACGEGETTEKLQEGEISVDADGDGYNSNDDCNDMNELIFPGVIEICDGLDNIIILIQTFVDFTITVVV